MNATIKGRNEIRGEIKVGGAKNAALPLLAALVVNPNVTLLNLPDLTDVKEMLSLLQKSGINYNKKENVTIFSAHDMNGDLSTLPSKIRASILLLGPLAVKNGESVLSYPGGCSIGKRPIDIHIQGLKAMGFDIKVEENFVRAKISHKLREARIRLPFPSVGATEHLMITAAMLKKTTTYISNCAREPEIVELQSFLNSMGARIKGAGTANIKIEGSSNFSTIDFKIMGDRIEAGTYVILSLINNGEIVINGVEKSSLNYVNFLREIGANLIVENSKIVARPSKIKGFHLETDPYPGFPTDLQPQMGVLALVAKGHSTITENIFENRLSHVEELKKMGAHISVDKNKEIKISGPQRLNGANVIGWDLRETAAITLAATIAEGKSVVKNFDILYRGYEKVDDKLKSLGVNIALKD